MQTCYCIRPIDFCFCFSILSRLWRSKSKSMIWGKACSPAGLNYWLNDTILFHDELITNYLKKKERSKVQKKVQCRLYRKDSLYVVLKQNFMYRLVSSTLFSFIFFMSNTSPGSVFIIVWRSLYRPHGRSEITGVHREVL